MNILLQTLMPIFDIYKYIINIQLSYCNYLQQKSKYSCDSLEDEFKELKNKDGQKIQFLYANKGLQYLCLQNVTHTLNLIEMLFEFPKKILF